MILYHGSKDIIDIPDRNKGKLHNDYGRGFYCTEELDLAKEWAVDEGRSGYANSYQLDIDGLQILNLNSSEYSILHWLAILLVNRTFDLHSDLSIQARRYLLDHFLPDYSGYDVIKGYRADDSYFAYAQDFLNNGISLSTLSRAMRLGNLGEQVVLKSEQAFEKISFLDAEKVDAALWYPAKSRRDYEARNDYRAMRLVPWKRGEVYMLKILEEEMKPDDVRIRY